MVTVFICDEIACDKAKISGACDIVSGSASNRSFLVRYRSHNQSSQSYKIIVDENYVLSVLQGLT
jgi:hypothetical protein